MKAPRLVKQYPIEVVCVLVCVCIVVVLALFRFTFGGTPNITSGTGNTLKSIIERAEQMHKNAMAHTNNSLRRIKAGVALGMLKAVLEIAKSKSGASSVSGVNVSQLMSRVEGTVGKL